MNKQTQTKFLLRPVRDNRLSHYPNHASVTRHSNTSNVHGVMCHQQPQQQLTNSITLNRSKLRLPNQCHTFALIGAKVLHLSIASCNIFADILMRQHLETNPKLIAFSTAATQTGAMITLLGKLYIKKAEHAVQPPKIAKHASRLSN
ncbi:unnamed protein product [Ceratitis capitata]|uniref:(Mediterranean fruit fly) hypothetical protein n=1 Tax=Ceratitis capitata TaxID=7213 RepID=A0A811UUH9_CERCA|nr:unnamed protein product [Ceratitis capitata]